jgi:macrolide-specific efflux system membrane fusion protein
MTSMTAQVFFLLGKAADVTVVPMAALRPAPRGGEGAYVARVANGNAIETRPVHIGIANRQFAEVKSGLSVGERVVVGGEEAAQQGPRAFRFRGF